jgi:hypothetical protein
MREDNRNGEKPESSLLSNHPGEQRNRSIIAFQKLVQTIEFGGGQERRILEEGPIEEVCQPLLGDEVVQVDI